MSKHAAAVEWVSSASREDFCRGHYGREHRWLFDGGMEIQASPAPSVVPAPWSNPALVDPEEAFVASVASCHMLTFLWLASKAGLAVSRYRDEAVGTMERNERGSKWISRVVLTPDVAYDGDRAPSKAEAARLHEEAHAQCFIANSVRTEIVVASKE